MVRRALAGFFGAVLGLLPLALVDYAANNPAQLGDLAPTSDQMLTLGTTALVGGLLLGGGVAGWIAGRKGGVRAGGMAGLFAAILYAGSLIGAILLGGGRGQEGLPYVQAHPLRSSAAIALVALVMVAIALVAGRIVSPPAPAAHATASQPLPPYSRQGGISYAPQRMAPSAQAPWPPTASRPREQASVPRPPLRQSAPRTPR